MIEQVKPPSCHQFTPCVQESHESESTRLEDRDVLSYRLLKLRAMLRQHTLKIQANIARLAKEKSQTLLPFAQAQVFFPLVHGHACLRPCHLLLIHSRKTHPNFVWSYPDARVPITILQDKHR